jgi:hypothetical protein
LDYSPHSIIRPYYACSDASVPSSGDRKFPAHWRSRVWHRTAFCLRPVRETAKGKTSAGSLIKLQRNLLYSVYVVTAAVIFALLTPSGGSAQDNPSSSGNPQDVCKQFALLDRIDCQTCISQGQPSARCEAEAFLGRGPLRTMLKEEGTAPAVVQQFPVTAPPPSAATTNWCADSSSPWHSLAMCPPINSPGAGIFAPISPASPQIWSWASPAQSPGNNGWPQQVSPGPVTKKDISTLCKAVKTATGIADRTLTVKGIIDTFHLSPGEAETVAETARTAAANRSLIFLIAAGTILYVVTEECKPESP